jgi:hypothetical protein
VRHPDPLAEPAAWPLDTDTDTDTERRHIGDTDSDVSCHALWSADTDAFAQFLVVALCKA